MISYLIQDTLRLKGSSISNMMVVMEGQSNHCLWSTVQSHRILGTRSEVLVISNNGTPLQYSCLENPMDGGAWWAAVHGVAGSWRRLSNFIFTFHFHALEKEMATYSSVLAWRIPEMGEPVGLPSVGSHSQTRLKRLSSSSFQYITGC